jgi:hypothetical protein
MWGALSDERTDLLFIVTTGPRQRSHSRVRVPQDLLSYFAVSIQRPISSKEYVKFSAYITGNNLRLRYEGQPFEAVRKTISVYSENHIKHKYATCLKCRIS